MQHGSMGGGGGGGGGMNGGDRTPHIGMVAAVGGCLAFIGLILMPLRWPAAFLRVVMFAVLLIPIAALGNPVLLFVALVICAVYINTKYMTHEHYRPSKNWPTPQKRQAEALAPYAEIRKAQQRALHETTLRTAQVMADINKKGTS